MAVTHKSYVDWNNTGVLPLSSTDESGYVRLAAGALIANHGRDQARAYTPPVAGQANWPFDNTTFRFSSQNTGSPLFGKINPGLLNQHTVNVPDVSAGYAKTVLNDGPFLYYRLDEIGGQAIDASGNALFGTYAGTYTPAQSSMLGAEPGGWYDYAVQFNGATGTLTAANSTLMNVGDTFSCDFWIKIDALPSSAVDIVNKGAGAYQIQLTTTGAIKLSKMGTGDICTSTTVVAVGLWCHVCITKSGATVHIYIDGNDVSGTVTNQTLVDTTSVLTVCLLTGTTVNVTLDELALYSSVLSSTRVAARVNAVGGYQMAVMTDKPVGYWRLDEASGTTAVDASGHTNTGTYSGGVTLAQTGALAVEPNGTSDTAALFDGVNGALTFPGSASTDVDDVFTIEAWVKYTVAPSTAYPIMRYNPGNGPQLAINSTKNLVLTSVGVGDIVASTSVVPNNGAWHHVAATKNGATVHLYLDGVDVTGAVTNHTIATDTTTVRNIGYNGFSTYLSGSLDEVALYSTALSTSRVQAHYNAGVSQKNAVSDQSSTYTFHTGYLDLPKELPGIAQQMVNEQSLDGLSILKQAIISTAELTNVTIDVAIGACLDAAGWPTALRDIEVAATTLNRWCVDNIDAFSAIRDLTFTEGANACFYLDPLTGKIKWENRHHRWLAQRSIVSQWTANAQGTEPVFGQEFSFDDGVRNIINSCTVPVNQYTIAALAVVWTGVASITIAPNQSVSYTVSTIANWFTGAVTPVAGTDYDVSVGSLTSVTLSRTSGKRATLTFTADASGATVTAHSPNTAIQMRAQAVTFTQVYISNSISGASTSGVDYKTKTLPTDFTPSWIPDVATAVDWCNFMVGRYKDPVPIVTFNLNDVSDQRLLYAMQARISDRIHVSEPLRSFVNFDAFVEQITDTVTMGSHHTRSFGCEQAQQQAFWILGVAGYSELGTTTRLGF